MGKRSNGEGTMYKRKDGRWCAAYFDDNYKRHYVYGKTQTEVKQELKEKKTQRPDNNKQIMTFQSWLKDITVKRYMLGIVINSALSMAVKLRILSENPNAFTSIPRKKKYEADCLNAEEVNRIANEAKNEELYPIIITTVYTGMRKGEVMALKWENVDFQEQKRRQNLDKKEYRAIWIRD